LDEYFLLCPNTNGRGIASGGRSNNCLKKHRKKGTFFREEGKLNTKIN
jgi:hypothetical protein